VKQTVTAWSTHSHALRSTQRLLDDGCGSSVSAEALKEGEIIFLTEPFVNVELKINQSMEQLFVLKEGSEIERVRFLDQLLKETDGQSRLKYSEDRLETCWLRGGTPTKCLEPGEVTRNLLFVGFELMKEREEAIETRSAGLAIAWQVTV
jgi:hypothetical protein